MCARESLQTHIAGFVDFLLLCLWSTVAFTMHAVSKERIVQTQNFVFGRFSNFFYPNETWTHPPTSKFFWDFWNFLTLQSPLTNLPCLKERQDSLCKKYFQNIMETTRRLNYLFPCQRCNKYDVRRFNKYPLPEIRTNRYLNSLIPWGLYHWQ